MTVHDDTRGLVLALVTAVCLGVTAHAGCGGAGSVPDGQAPSPEVDGRPSPPQSVVATTLEQQIIAATNDARGDEGRFCGPTEDREAAAYPPSHGLLVDERLVASARAHAEAMAASGVLEHQTEDAIRAVGGLAENIGDLGPAVSISSGDAAPGIPWDDSFATRVPRPAQVVPAQLVDMWLLSPGHCHNMLNHRWTHMGAAAALSDDTWYGVQMFGTGGD